MTSTPTSKDEIKVFIDELVKRLDERQRWSRAQIARIVKGAGVAFAQEMYQLTLETEARGGLMLLDGSRRRTKGGVFFYLARMRLSAEMRRKIFPKGNKRKQTGQKASSSLALPGFVWEERAATLEGLMKQPGTVSRLKVVLSGRPERLKQMPGYVILWIPDPVGSVTVPKGVPQPPAETTLYRVYLALQSWQQVEKALANPEDKLIIEGTAALDTESREMILYATRATTKLLAAE